MFDLVHVHKVSLNQTTAAAKTSRALACALPLACALARRVGVGVGDERVDGLSSACASALSAYVRLYVATAAAAMAQPSARKLRLLCLHGMYQNADTFAAKTKHFRALQRSDDAVEYIYIDGPFTVTPPILAKKQQQHASPSRDTAMPSRQLRPRNTERLFRAWWRPSGPHQAGPTQLDSDRDVLLAFLRAQLAELGEIDGVLGFSQGASLASWLCSTQARLELRWSPRIAILIGSYLGPQQYSLASGILPATSSLHMFGLNDHVISAAKSRAVVDVFRHAQVRESCVCAGATRARAGRLTDSVAGVSLGPNEPRRDVDPQPRPRRAQVRRCPCAVPRVPGAARTAIALRQQQRSVAAIAWQLGCSDLQPLDTAPCARRRALPLNITTAERSLIGTNTLTHSLGRIRSSELLLRIQQRTSFLIHSLTHGRTDALTDASSLAQMWLKSAAKRARRRPRAWIASSLAWISTPSSPQLNEPEHSRVRLSVECFSRKRSVECDGRTCEQCLAVDNAELQRHKARATHSVLSSSGRSGRRHHHHQAHRRHVRCDAVALPCRRSALGCSVCTAVSTKTHIASTGDGACARTFCANCSTFDVLSSESS